MATIHVPQNAELLDAFDTAKAAGMRLFIDGRRAVIAREKPTQGLWAEVKLRVIAPRRARFQEVACSPV